MNSILVIMLLFVNVLGSHSAYFVLENKCSSTIWPATLAGGGTPQLDSTGFELASGASVSLNVPSGWSGRVWARTLCSTDATARFRCNTGDCGSGTITCNGLGGEPPATLIEFTLANHDINHQDFYDISLVDGFNLPVSVTPQGGSGDYCNPLTCPVDLNSRCPTQLGLTGPSGTVIGCKSACMVFGQPQYCCTGLYGSPTTCPPTEFSNYFKSYCPQAYSYAYDDHSSLFTCNGGPNYLITFCP